MTNVAAKASPEVIDPEKLAFLRGSRVDTAPRQAVRRVCAIKAEVRTDDGRRTDCTIRDVSATGARLGLSPAFPLPASFDLAVIRKGKAMRVYLVWHVGSYAGVTIFKPIMEPTTATMQTIPDDAALDAGGCPRSQIEIDEGR